MWKPGLNGIKEPTNFGDAIVNTFVRRTLGTLLVKLQSLRGLGLLPKPRHPALAVRVRESTLIQVFKVVCALALQETCT